MPAGVGGPPGADPNALYARAAEQVRLGRLDDDARTLADLLRQAPGHADACNLGGIVAHRRGDLRAAVAFFGRAIAAGAGAGVHANLGYAYEKLGDVAAAERAYTTATTRAPALGFAWQKLASLQHATGRPELALASWRRAIALDPQDLKSHPGSVLWLVAPKLPAGTRNLRAEAARRGVAGERLVFAPMVSRRQHLARLALADLALDTHPYNSGTTASDALRVGVPLLTFAGTSFVSRMAASPLHAAGLGDGVLPDRDAMVARAIALGLDPAARTALRAHVPAAVRASGLFDPPAFARDLERLYAEMHAQRRAGRRETIVLGTRN